MSATIWRIAHASDLSGVGSSRSGGRWNRKGTPIVYCSGSIALAILEVIGHLRSDQMDRTRYVVRVEVPDPVWDACAAMTVPDGWSRHPFGAASQDAGTAWAIENNSALLRVPSALVPEEDNLLVNPAHPDAAHLRATVMRLWVPFGFLYKKEDIRRDAS